MASKQQLMPLQTRDGADTLELELPVYAARYLRHMCNRERVRLTNFAALGAGDAGIEAALDALQQIERAIA